MSELDTELTALRHRLRDSLAQPDLVDIAARARQRTARRRTLWTVIAAVLVVAAAVPLLRTVTADAPAADRLTASVYPHLVRIEFVTPERGYAIESNCPFPTGDDCRYALLATADGGRTWSARPLPPTAAGKIYTRLDELYVIGEDDLVVDRTTPDDRNERIRSEDGGQTWSVVTDPFATERAEAITSAGYVVSGCPRIVGDRFAPIPPCATVATIRADGRTAPLAVQPPLTDPSPGYYPTTDGTWWVRGRNPSTGELALSVSRDDGRTWTTGGLGLPFTTTWQTGVSMAEHDGTLYASVAEWGTTPRGKLAGMFTSTDGGASWTRTHTYTDKGFPRSVAGDLLATPNGDVLVNSLYDNRKTYVTTDGGATFTEAERPFAGVVHRTLMGYVEMPWRPVRTEYALSVDGVEWREFRVG